MNTNLDAMLKILRAHDERPGLYEKGTANIWTDDHLSIGMLEAHLNDETDAASFRTAKRGVLIDFIQSRCPAAAFPSVLDIGCGPGLIARELAVRGYAVTGVDFSPRSIAYAREQAEREKLSIRYVEGNYLTADYPSEHGEGYDLAVMISFDFGVLAPEERAVLLKKIHKALRPGGLLLLDVFTINHPVEAECRKWESGTGGYWSEGDYLLLNHLWQYESAVSCRQSMVMDEKGMRVFHIWEHLFTPEELTNDFREAGFEPPVLHADHTGAPFMADSERMYALARK